MYFMPGVKQNYSRFNVTTTNDFIKFILTSINECIMEQ